MSNEQLKELIKNIHHLWYQEDCFQDPSKVIRLHGFMGELFDFAEITSTLVEHNPDKISPDDFRRMIINKFTEELCQ